MQVNCIYLELQDKLKYIGKHSKHLKMTVNNNGEFMTGDIIPVCVGDIKVTEAKVTDIGLLSAEISLFIPNKDSYIPTFAVRSGIIYDYGKVDKQILKNFLLWDKYGEALEHIVPNIKY